LKQVLWQQQFWLSGLLSVSPTVGGLVKRTPLKRTSQLKQKTPLKQGTPLARGAPLKKRSNRERSRVVAYQHARKRVYERAEGRCELGTPACTHIGTEAHHRKGRDGDLVADDSLLAWTCSDCHRYAHGNPKEAYERGWLVRRNSKPDDA